MAPGTGGKDSKSHIITPGSTHPSGQTCTGGRHSSHLGTGYRSYIASTGKPQTQNSTQTLRVHGVAQHCGKDTGFNSHGRLAPLLPQHQLPLKNYFQLCLEQRKHALNKPSPWTHHFCGMLEVPN